MGIVHGEEAVESPAVLTDKADIGMSAVGGKACVGVFHFNAVVSPAVNVLLLVIVIHRDIMVKIQLKYTEYAVAVRRIAHGSDRKAVAFTFK